MLQNIDLTYTSRALLFRSRFSQRKTGVLFKYFSSLLVAPASPITENTNGNRYENAFFGLAVEKPKGWVSQDVLQLIKTLLPTGSSMIFGNKNKFSPEVIDLLIKKTLPLFGFFKYTPGIMNRKMNPNIMAVAENIQANSSIKTGCNYLNLVREMLKDSLHKVTFLDECQEVDINGKMFATQSFSMKLMGVLSIKQTHYARIAKKDHALSFTLTYFNRASKSKLDKVMQSLKFSQE